MNLYNYVGTGKGKKFNSTPNAKGFRGWQVAVLAFFGFVLIGLVVFCLALKNNVKDSVKETQSEFINRADEVLFNAYSLSFDLTLQDPGYLPDILTEYYGDGEIYISGVITKTGAFGVVTSDEWKIYPTFFVVIPDGTYLMTNELAYILESKDRYAFEGFTNNAGSLWENEHPETYIKVGEGTTGQEILRQLRTVLSDRCFSDMECENGFKIKGSNFEKLEEKGYITDAYFTFVKEAELEIILAEDCDENGNLINVLSASGEKGNFTATITENRQYIPNPVISDVISPEEFTRQMNELIEANRYEITDTTESDIYNTEWSDY